MILKIDFRGRLYFPKAVRDFLGVEPGSEVLVRIDERNRRLIIKKKPESWTDYSKGLGKEIWKGIDVDEWLRKERDSWDRRIR